jgi:hypothetical protein
MDHIYQQNSIVKDDDRIVIPVSGAAIGTGPIQESVCGGGRVSTGAVYTRASGSLEDKRRKCQTSAAALHL